ncbi:unnamed protein product [Soboliphyme baturini]|uniref:2-Hacid_dh domain-containing protein n=1 Tax=Soboliphyme baturini TaxID=241478 RepID=A0A183IJ37_9BILA|nr:unnamed protein product [Soboliphyme baturini]
MLIECVLILDGVDESCAQALARSCISVQQFDSLPKDRLTNLIQDYDAVVVRSSTKITKDIIDAGKRLKVIARAGSGLDNIDIEAAEARQIVVIK